jgi:hypothetical protein
MEATMLDELPRLPAEDFGNDILPVQYWAPLDALHPRTLLAYEMNFRPLGLLHGALLRLRVEKELGFKMAKWIGAIEFVADVTKPRFTPRQVDLLFVVGTITQRLALVLRRVYEQMTEPKWVVSFGACTSSGGPYDNYDGLLKLQYRVQHERPGKPFRLIHGTGRKLD